MLARSAKVGVLGMAGTVLAIGFFVSSASADSATVYLTRGATTVPENGPVRSHEQLAVHVKGFAANSTVLVQFGPVASAADVVTNASGAGVATITVPKLAPDVYVVSATTDLTDATTVVTVADTIVPLSDVSGGTSKVATTSRTATKSSGSRGALAHTGSSSAARLSIAGLMLLALGLLFSRLGVPIAIGRHERRPGAHLA